MILSKNTRVQFFEGPHTYLLDGDKTLSGVTTLMRRQGLSPDYSDIPESVLMNAAARGTDLHRAIQAYIQGGLYLPEDEGTLGLLEQFKTLPNKFIASEYLISDNRNVASSIDLVEEVDENGVVLWDIKRTSTLHWESVKWQLSIYAYLFHLQNPLIEVRGVKALHLYETMKVVELPIIDQNEIKRLLDTDADGGEFIPESLPLAMEEIAGHIADYFNELADMEEKQKSVKVKLEEEKEKLRAFMEKSDLKSWECAGILMTRIFATTRKSVDSKALQKLYPEAYAACLKESPVKESLKITRKDKS